MQDFNSVCQPLQPQHAAANQTIQGFYDGASFARFQAIGLGATQS